MRPPYPLPTVIDWLASTLDPTRCDDYGPNGLQVEVTTEVRRVATGVTANLAFIEAAAAWGADLAIVHHGLYWQGAQVTITGALGRRVRALVERRLSLVAYHLPLDGHPELGNAPNLARALGLIDITPAFPARGVMTGCTGRFREPLGVAAAHELIAARISRACLFFAGGGATLATVGVVTGGAPRQASEAAARGLDLYITGEAGEYTQATALEEKIHIAACGHHRTEVFGPRALAAALPAAFPGLETRFIDVDNPA
ncbi:MAG: Nif3-like dinuclear metal center hexameric protein [Deltaproteobacteria bacterium]|nr:Nif3-like dinuclear metal center hexameric protein [Deltaproteobacteria bacterium]